MAYLQITLDISNKNRAAAAGVYQKDKTPFLTTIEGATSEELLVRDEDVQVLHGLTTVGQAYLNSLLFTQDVVAGLKPFLYSAPDVRIFDIM